MSRKIQRSAPQTDGDVILHEGVDEIAKMQQMSDENILKAFVIKSKDPNDSKQLISDDEFMALYQNNEVYEPFYYPLLWASLMEKNTRLAKLIRTYARNTVGMGWEIKAKKPITKDTKKSEKKLIETETEKLQTLFDYPNPELPFNEVMYQVKVDEEATGNGYLEVARSMTGEITGLYHVPSHTIRIMKSLKGFVQIRAGTRRYFKNFGQDFDMDMETGETGPKGSVPFSIRANEIIHFKIYSPRDSFYGVPRYVAAADAIAGSKMAARRNLAFFKNDATPRMAIVVQNGKLDGHSIANIEKFVNSSGKGPENAHRVMVLQAQSRQTPGYNDMSGQAVKIDVVPLTVANTDDASHIKYRSANDDELREAFGIGEVFLGAKGSVNRATAVVSRAITNEQEFIPDAQVKEYKINSTICRDMGIKMVNFEFVRPNSIDEFDKANIFARYLQGGGITPNDIRHELGKDPYTESWGDQPLQIGLVEYQMGLLGAQGAVSQGGKVGDNGDGQESGKEGESGNNAGSNGNESGNSGKQGDESGSNNQATNAKTKQAVAFATQSIQKMIEAGLPKVLIDLDTNQMVELPEDFELVEEGSK